MEGKEKQEVYLEYPTTLTVRKVVRSIINNNKLK